MPKRKRDGSEALTPNSDEESVTGIRQQRVEHKLVHGHKLLTRAFKIAKGFERQKLGRRRKTAADKSDAKEVTRIDAETEAVKTLDFSSAAQNFLYKSLLKSKAVAESPDLPKRVLAPVQSAVDTAAINVIARLCNSNPVKEALPSVLRDITQALGVEPIKEAGKNRKKQATKEQEKQTKSKRTDAATTARRPISDDYSLSERHAGMQSGGDDDNEDGFAQFDGKIAGSSDSEDDSSGDEMMPAKSKASRAEILRNAATDISPSPTPSPSPEPAKGRASKNPSITKSAFVPSLTMGGYWSGSESEPEDDIDVAPRKNRRGQKARQAIAELKFGSSAKHLAKQQESGKRDREKGWDPKRGATDGARRFDRGGRRGGFDKSHGQSRSGANPSDNAPPKKKHRDDEGALHPSWLAAKMAKEAKATAPFQGKKITFD